MEEDTYLSDESSFYGDNESKARLEEHVELFDVQAWWRERTASMEEIAITNKAKNAASDAVSGAVKLYNPYQGFWYARQLHESVEQFLERLPPETSLLSHKLPWIFIANPFIPRKPLHRELEELETGESSTFSEVPPEDESYLEQFKTQGQKLLEELDGRIAVLTKDMAGKAPSLLTKAINKQRENTVIRIKELAVTCRINSGKWMLFPPPHLVNETWSLIARNTATNSLGIAAKVAPRDVGKDSYGREPRLVCVYTADFNDEADVLRVLQKLRQLGVVELKGRPVYYKMDAYTHLKIGSGNQLGIKASLYSSANMLKPLKEKS